MLFVLLAGCSSGQNDNRYGLEPHLLTPGDVARDWIEKAYPGADSTNGVCGQAPSAVFDGRAIGASGVLIRSTDGARTTIVETILQRNEPEAHSLLAELRTQASSCREFNDRQSALELHIVLSDLTVPPIGDERVAYRERASFVGFERVESIVQTTYVETAIVRGGGVVMALSLASSEMSDHNDALFNRVLEAAYKKLSGR